VPFFRRLLSGDYRRAVAAEAAGDYAEAARHYGLCGERAKVAEMHLLRAERAAAAIEAIEDLRDALRWAEPGTPIRRRVTGALGGRLLERARAEGAETARDRQTVREAAGLLVEAGEHLRAGKALEQLGDDEGAARAYERGGHLEEMEEALARERFRRRRDGRLRDAFARYGADLAAGRRAAALAALRECEEAADDKGEYRRLREALEARVLSAGAVAFAGLPRRLVCAGAPEVRIGRDPEAHFSLRGAGLSRAHATLRADGDRFHVRDAGSRLGTWLAGLRLDGEVPLAGEGRLGLGEDCELTFTAAPGRLRLEVARGLDRGAVLLAVAPGVAANLSAEGLPATLRFADGRPVLEAAALALNGAPAYGPVELARGDAVSVGGVEAEVA
jgi:tetratricopeptide (TPR) repeat protein